MSKGRRTSVEVLADAGEAGARILTPEALAFVADLQREFGPTRLELLAARAERQQRTAAGELPDFLAEASAVREDPEWRVAPAPRDLLDRRVEITGPVDRIQAALAARSVEGARALAHAHVLSSFHLLESILEQVGVRPGAWR